MAVHTPIEAFRDALDPALRDAFDVDGLVDVLAASHRRGAQAWPGVAIDPVVFAAHVGARMVAGAPMETLAIEDLYLACALTHGDTAAIRVLEREMFPQIVAVLARRGLGRDGVDELAQTLREHLLVATAARPGRIADFRGQGSLRSWIIVAAVRMSNRAGHRERRDGALPLASVADVQVSSAELAIDRHEYRERLEHACELALRELPSRERALLRLQLVDGASIDQIGRIYGVHRATAARWLANARTMILEHTQQRLAADLGVDAAVAAGIAELVQSQLDVSVARLLQTVSS